MTHNRCIIKQIIRQFSLILASMEKNLVNCFHFFTWVWLSVLVSLHLCYLNPESLPPKWSDTLLKFYSISLRKQCPYLELFWSALPHMRTEYGKIQIISPHSVRMRENADQKNSKYKHFLCSVCHEIFKIFQTILGNSTLKY